MEKKVLVLGGYGNFGSRICLALAKENIAIIIAGRNIEKGKALQQRIIKKYPQAKIELASFDVRHEFADHLTLLRPTVVIDTVGPFQTSDYSIAECCINHHVHYLDLADARDFVVNIKQLDDKAKANDVLVVSGASTVPGLSSAVIEYFQPRFASIEDLTYGISPGQKASRGLATTQSILTYLGKPLKSVASSQAIRYGWQGLYRQPYPEIGKRWMGFCDVPDLDLFPQTYGIQSIQFYAGMESTLLHLGMWLTSWLVRIGLPLPLSKHANTLLHFSKWFDWQGTADGGMFMLLTGKDKSQGDLQIKWFIIAKENDGPEIPCVPAILLAKKLVHDEINYRGAVPCVGLVSLDEYLAQLKNFSISTIVL